MRFFFSVVCLALSASYVLGANPCIVNGLAGTCISKTSCNNSGGTSTSGFCPLDPSNIRCCTYGTCRDKYGFPGECISTQSCAGSSGISVPGLCPGPKDIQCCFEPFNSAAVIAAARSRLGLPYSWSGGHRLAPGPSLGRCDTYTGPIKPCLFDKIMGLDCSGLVRDAIYHGIGLDLANGGSAKHQIKDPHTRIIPYEDRQPGDIEFFGTRDSPYHVILYIGNDMMIEAQKPGTLIHEVPLRTGGIWARVRN